MAAAKANPPLDKLPPWLRPCVANKGRIPPLIHHGFFYDMQKLVQIAEEKHHTSQPHKDRTEHLAVKGLEELSELLHNRFSSWLGCINFACAYGGQHEGGFLAFCTNHNGQEPPVEVVELAAGLVAIDDGKAKWCIDYEDKYWT